MGYRINKYGSETINIVCNDNISCNNINITINEICGDTDDKIELLTTWNIFHYIIIISVVLICFMNIICCFYWICYKYNQNNQVNQHNQHIETLKPPNNDINIYKIDNNNNNNNNNNDETIDLENAPILDLSDLDESISFNNITRKDPNITFWNEQPESPKKQDNINYEKHNFEEENDKNEKKEQDLCEIEAPNITNINNNLPIPPKFEVNFKFLNPSNEPSHVSVITPRNYNNDKKLMFSSKEINENELNANDLLLTAPQNNENNENNNENKNKNITLQKNKNGKTGKFLKNKSREFISKEENIYEGLNHVNSFETDKKSQIVKFNVNDTLKRIIMENKEISNNTSKHFKIKSPRNIINKIKRLSPRNKDNKLISIDCDDYDDY
eukprot:211498_1